MPEENNISYCLSKLLCSDRVNPGHELTHCQNCGAKLLVKDRYRLIKRLDKEKSNMDRKVFEAIDTVTNEIVVLKIIDYPNEELKKYLEREYEFLLLAGPLFPKLKEEDFFEWIPDPKNDWFVCSCLVLPKIDGIDTEDWISQNGPISEEECVDWMLKILDFLSAMWQANYIYRDLKPSNIMRRDDGTLQLIDFDTVTQVDSIYFDKIQSLLDDPDSNDIYRGTRIATYGYAPPEQLRGQAVRQSDFFALGRTAIYWLSGQSPVELTVDNAELNIQDVRPDLSDTFVHYLNSLLEYQASQRPLNIEAIRFFLEKEYPQKVAWEKRKKANKWRRFTKILCISILLIIGSYATSEFFLGQARKSIETEDYQRAIDELKIARATNPISWQVIREQAYAHLWNGNNEIAKEKFEITLEYSPNDTGALYHLGILNENIGEIELAKSLYQKTIDAEPIAIEPHLRLSRLALSEGNLFIAEQQLKQVQDKIQKHPEKKQPDDDYFVNFYLGWLNFKKKNFSEANTQLKASFLTPIHVKPNFSVTLGDIACLLGETEKQLDKSINIELWKECFTTTTATPIGQEIRIQRMEDFIKNSPE